MKKILASFALLVLSTLGHAQTYPSPTYQGITVRGITGLQLDNGTSAASSYGGTSCTNQFPRSLSASGAATCSSVALTSDVSGTLPVSSGGTGAAIAGGTSLDNITGFSSTGFLTRTGAGTYAFQSLTNGITYANLAQAPANTLLGNATGATANVSAITVTGCNGAAQALQWTNGTGFGCNSSVATSGSNSNITSLSGLTTPLSVSQGGTGGASLAQYQILAGSGTGAITTVGAGTAGQVLTSNGSSAYPTFQNPATLTGRLIDVQVFTSSGTYTPTIGTNSVVVEIVGGGGAGGGAPAIGASQCSAAAGGSAGGYIETRMTSGFSGATITVGAGGIASAGAAGGAGGATSFGALTANGGSGGYAGAPASVVNANNSGGGGTSSAGSIQSQTGATGSPSLCQESPLIVIAGHGANGPRGGGGSAGLAMNGNAATGYGAGGGGSVQFNSSSSALTGGAGSQGVVIVWEYD